MFSDFHGIAKRIKLRHDSQERTYFPKRYDVPKEGYTLPEDTPEEGIVFYEPEEEEYFEPLSQEIYFSLVEEEEEYEILPEQVLKLLENPVELHKAASIIDRVHEVKRLRDPDRWCVLPESETVTREVPLTEYEDSYYGKEVVQEIGHVARYKAFFHLDNRVYESEETDVGIRQVLHKVEAVRLPRWKNKNSKTRPWDLKFIGAIEVPGTIFCTEHEILKKRKYITGTKPEVVHQKDVSHETRGTGCSVFRRNQPPGWTYHRQPAEEENDKIWNGLEDRNQWVFLSLYHIWAGEERQPGEDWRERVYWTGPAQYYKRNEYLECHFPPYCVVVEDEVEPEVTEVDEDAEAW